MDLNELGQKVVARRQELGLSQDALAEKAKVSRPYISLIERGEAQNISVRVLLQLADALNFAPSELISDSKGDGIVISSSLREFARQFGLTYDVVERLARIPIPEREPKSIRQWFELYKLVNHYISTEPFWDPIDSE